MTDSVKKFDGFSDDDLKAELNRRAELAKETARQKRGEKVKLVLEHRDTLLKFINHSRKSCDSSPNPFYNDNGYPDCNRCALEDLEEWADDIEVTVEVTLRRVED